MPKGKVFLVGNERGQLVPMTETEYEKEDILQEYLERFPDLIPGDQIDPEDPPRWLFVGREVGVPGEVGEPARWSLDHLYLDHNAVPTFIECKRSSDTRARREVVAQMLDYAANGIEYWSIAKLREDAAKSAQKKGKTLEEELCGLLGLPEPNDQEFERFWKQVEENLRAGYVRLVFVADETTKELRRLVEFLNSQMVDTQVLAVELKQFLGENHKVLVPRVIGMTEASRTIKDKGTGGSAKRTTREDFLRKVEDPNAVKFFNHILDLAEKNGHTIYWGEKGFSIRVYLKSQSRLVTFAYGWPTGSFQFFFADLPLSDTEEAALRQKLMDYGIFKKSGNKTLTAAVRSGTIETVEDAFDFILQEMDKLADR